MKTLTPPSTSYCFNPKSVSNLGPKQSKPTYHKLQTSKQWVDAAPPRPE